MKILVFGKIGQRATELLRLGAERDKLTIVADQIGGPTAAALKELEVVS